ncbi:type 1 glutamine amidotransferase family protein [Tateyamaria pelophila]|uniref:hypothetical protein n=1 Tax=Tateyamaria pelophila TaxID=328415 RepID=UPI001CBFD0CD|nr:hypothetical protein [Tateyamaria pelophila]
MTPSGGTTRAADEKIDGVAIVVSAENGQAFTRNKPSQDFVSDAVAYAKFIASTQTAKPLFDVTGIAGQMDEAMMELEDHSAKEFVTLCRSLRFWDREKSLLD